MKLKRRQRGLDRINRINRMFFINSNSSCRSHESSSSCRKKMFIIEHKVTLFCREVDLLSALGTRHFELSTPGCRAPVERGTASGPTGDNSAVRRVTAGGRTGDRGMAKNFAGGNASYWNFRVSVLRKKNIPGPGMGTLIFEITRIRSDNRFWRIFNMGRRRW